MTPNPPTPADGVPSRHDRHRALRRATVLLAGVTLATAPFVAFGLEPRNDDSLTSSSAAWIPASMLVSPIRERPNLSVERTSQAATALVAAPVNDATPNEEAEAAAAAMAVLAEPYSWGERSVRVAVLQQVLGETVDGWYASATLRSHRRALEFVGGATDALPVPPAAAAGGAGLAALRQCESGGNYSAVSSSGRYRGAYQFDQTTWNSVAQRHDPSLVGVDPAGASPGAQDAMAQALFDERGRGPWPVCGRRM